MMHPGENMFTNSGPNLIISSSCGGGHMAAASSLQNALSRAHNSNTYTTVIDINREVFSSRRCSGILPKIVSYIAPFCWNQSKKHSFSGALRFFDRCHSLIDQWLSPYAKDDFLSFLERNPGVKDVYIVQPMFLQGLLGAISAYNSLYHTAIKAHIIFTDLFGPDCNYVDPIAGLSQESESVLEDVQIPYFKALGPPSRLRNNARDMLGLSIGKIKLSGDVVGVDYSDLRKKEVSFNFTGQGVAHSLQGEISFNQKEPQAVGRREYFCFVMLGGYPDEKVLLQYINAIYLRKRRDPVCLYVVFNSMNDSLFYAKVRRLVARFDFNGFRLVVAPAQERHVILSAMKRSNFLVVRKSGMSSMEALATHHSRRQVIVHEEDSPSWEEQNARVLKKCLNAENLPLSPIFFDR